MDHKFRGIVYKIRRDYPYRFHNAVFPFPYDNPALFSMAIAFGGIWLFSKTDKSKRASLDKAGFPAQFVRSETGIGAAGAVAY